jgi:hypothetical protein
MWFWNLLGWVIGLCFIYFLIKILFEKFEKYFVKFLVMIVDVLVMWYRGFIKYKKSSVLLLLYFFTTYLISDYSDNEKIKTIFAIIFVISLFLFVTGSIISIPKEDKDE